MKDSILINNKKKAMSIFHSLMAVEFHIGREKTKEDILQELKKFEDQGKLRIYRPEEE